MTEYVSQDNLYLGVTPTGSYYAVQDRDSEPARNFIQQLLQTPETPLFNQDLSALYSGLEGEDGLKFVHWMQKAGLIYGTEIQEAAPQDRLEDILPSLLKPLADTKKIALAESQGFYLGAIGFTHEASEELAAMSTELINNYDRHKALLSGNLHLKQRGWGLIDSLGNSEIGFWPIFIGNEVFTLIAEGMPQFNQEAFRQLIWALSIRYDNTIF
ncbi:MAG: hypothetical protein KAH22_10895 [Thiotrichaceae bacterium]|nr:hypothetical protein [Thiotrichaceae bacterium]